MKNEEKMLLEQKAKRIRYLTAKSIANLGVGHIGGSMDLADVLSVLYFKQMRIDPQNPRKEGRDRLIVSKGHAGPVVYAALCERGYFPEEELLTLNKIGTNLPSHCDMNRTIGIDMSTGSLGQGISAAAGVALGSKLTGDGAVIYGIVGDGECQEGQVWECFMAAAHYKLDNFIVFVDYNKMQIDGMISEIMALEPLDKKLESFGFFVQSVDGHDVEEIDNAIEAAKEMKGKSSIIILNTIKGKGVRMLEDMGLANHNAAFTMEQFEQVKEELI